MGKIASGRIGKINKKTGWAGSLRGRIGRIIKIGQKKQI
jgi:hypothetical protein